MRELAMQTADPKLKKERLELAEAHRKLALKANEQIAVKKAKPTE